MGKFFVHRLITIINATSASISVFLNGFLIFLILTKSPKEFGVSKYLMVFISFFEIVYSLLETALVPIHYTAQATSVVLVNVNYTVVPRSYIRIVNSAYWAFFGSSMALFALQFIYRYFAISMNKLIKTFNSWKIIFWLMIPFANGIVWAMTGLMLCSPNEETTNYLRPFILEDLGESMDNIDYMGGITFQILKDGTIKFYWNILLIIGFMSAVVTFSFAVILFCGIKSYLLISDLNAITTSSAKSQSLQSQLFYALVFQTVVPSLLLHFPVSVMFAFVFANHGLRIYSSIISITISFYPAIDPLPNFFIISPYRKAAFGCILKHCDGISYHNEVPNNSRNVVAPAS